MARVGRFGRNRRLGSSNLTQIIANLMREQRQAEDRAAFDAWQNGGEFKGKPMTDERILGYIKGRRDMMAKDDPLWDQWNNTLIQTTFSIGESKIGLAFKQGKVSAGAVAGWYRQQLNSIPRNSEFYRDVAGRAAEWAKSAAGSARAAAGASARKAAEAKYDRLQGVIAQGEALTSAVAQEAVRRGVISDAKDIFSADASNLEAMFDAGVTINGQAVSIDSWRQTLVTSYQATRQLRPVYKVMKWDTSGLSEKIQRSLEPITAVNAIDDRAQAEVARDLWIERVGDAQNDPYAIAKATSDYVAALGGVLKNAQAGTGLAEDQDAFVGGLVNEINAANGQATGETFAEIYGQARRGDGEETAANVAANQANLAALADGSAYYGQDEAGGPYKVLPDPLGTDRQNPALQRTVAFINGQYRETYLRGEEVRGAVLVQSDGKGGTQIVDPSTVGNIQQALDGGGYAVQQSDQVLGYVFQDGAGKVNYGVYKNGALQFTEQNPFATLTSGSQSGQFLAIGSGTLDEQTSKPVFDSAAAVASLFSRSGLTGTYNPLPIATGADGQGLAQYLASTGDAADAAVAAEIRAQLNTGTSLGNGQLSDAQMERRRGQTQSPYAVNAQTGFTLPSAPTVNAQTGFSTAGIVQGALSETLTSIQSGLAPLFGAGAPRPAAMVPPSTRNAPPTPAPAPAPTLAPPAAPKLPPPPVPKPPPAVNPYTGFTIPKAPKSGTDVGGTTRRAI